MCRSGQFFRPAGGWISDRAGGAKVLAVLFVIAALCMAGVSSLPPLSTVIVLLFIGMMALGMGNGAVFQLVPQHFAKEIGMVTGIVGAAGGIGGFFLPNILGSLKQMTGTYAIGFISFSCIALLAFVLVLAAGYFWRKSYGTENSPADV